MSTLTINLPDGSARELPVGSTAGDLAASIGSRLAKAAVAAVVNGAEADLGARLPEGATVSIVTADSDAGRHVLRHSTAHVLAQAVTQLFPGAKFSIGPAIEDGFYYDFDLPGGRTFSESDLTAITDRMKQIVAANQPFVRSEVSVDEALRLFADQPYKCEIINRVTSGSADGADSGEVGGVAAQTARHLSRHQGSARSTRSGDRRRHQRDGGLRGLHVVECPRHDSDA